MAPADSISASTPLKKSLAYECDGIESSISAAIENIMNGTLGMNKSPDTTAVTETQQGTPKPGKKVRSSVKSKTLVSLIIIFCYLFILKEKKTTLKKGRKSAATVEPAVPLSRIKSDIDFDETNTNDMLYSEDTRGVDTDEEASQPFPLTKKEQRQKLKEQKAQQAQAEASIVYNPICNNVAEKIPPGCSEADCNLFKRVQEMSRQKLKQDELKSKSAQVQSAAPVVASGKAGRKSGAAAASGKQETSGKLLIDSINQFQQASSRLPAYITFGNFSNSFFLHLYGFPFSLKSVFLKSSF